MATYEDFAIWQEIWVRLEWLSSEEVSVATETFTSTKKI